MLEFTEAGERRAPWTGFFLLSDDRFGTTRVLTWVLEPSVCELADTDVPEPDLKAFVSRIKNSTTCGGATARR